MSRTWLFHSAFHPQIYKLLMRMSFRGLTCNFVLLYTCYCCSNPLPTYIFFNFTSSYLCCREYLVWLSVTTHHKTRSVWLTRQKLSQRRSIWENAFSRQDQSMRTCWTCKQRNKKLTNKRKRRNKPINKTRRLFFSWLNHEFLRRNSKWWEVQTNINPDFLQSILFSIIPTHIQKQKQPT